MNRAFGTHNPIRLSTESAESAFSSQPNPNPEFACVSRRELSWNESGFFGPHNPIHLSTESAESAFSYQPEPRTPGFRSSAQTRS